MSDNISRSGFFRDAYRVKVGEGRGAEVLAKTKGLDNEVLKALMAKAKTKWPGANFEFRLIEKQGGSYLEVLRQKQSTLDKDAKPSFSYQDAKPDQTLHARDQRRLDAVKVLVARGLIAGRADADESRAATLRIYRANQAADGESVGLNFFSRNADRGVQAAGVFRDVEESVSRPPPPERVDPRVPSAVSRHVSRSVNDEPVEVDEPNPFEGLDFEPNELTGPKAEERLKRLAEYSKREAAGVSGDQLKDHALNLLRQTTATLDSIGLHKLAAGAKKVKISGFFVSNTAVETRAVVDGQTKVVYYDQPQLKRLNKDASKVYQAPTANEMVRNALLKAGLKQKPEALHDQLKTVEIERRKDLTTAEVWGSGSLEKALLDHVVKTTLEPLAGRQEAIGSRAQDLGAKDHYQAPIGADRLLVQLVALEHIGALTHDAVGSAALLQQHQELGQKLLDYLGLSCAEHETLAVAKYLLDARSALTEHAKTTALENFPSAAAANHQRQVDKQAKALAERMTVLKELPTQAVYTQKIQTARDLIEARAAFDSERRLAALAAGGTAAKSVPRLAEHRTDPPKESWSNDPDWRQLCNYIEAVNKLGQDGRTGIEGYRDGKRVPSGVVNRQFKQGASYDPVVATKIVSTMRELMESGADGAAAGRPVKVYLPAAKPGELGNWKTLTQFDSYVPLTDKQLRVSLARLIELEFLAAYSPNADVRAIGQMKSIHDTLANQVTQGVSVLLDTQADEVRSYVQKATERFIGLVSKAEKQAKTENPDFIAILDGAEALRLDRSERRWLGSVAPEAVGLGGARVGDGMAVEFAPDTTEAALEGLFSAGSSYDEKSVAASSLLRVFSGSKETAQTREALASNLAQRLRVASPSLVRDIPFALRALAAASSEESLLRATLGQEVKTCLVAIGAVPFEEVPAHLLDRGRLAYQEELDKHLDMAVDVGRVKVYALTSGESSPEQATKPEVMGKKFFEAARLHFAEADEKRPFTALLNADGAHWVSLTAYRGQAGKLACVAVDTNTDAAPAWFAGVKAANPPAVPGGAVEPIQLNFFGGSLQEERHPNACGPLQARFIQSLQKLEPGADVGKHAQTWSKTGGLAKDPELAQWQVLADRALIMQSAVDAGQSKIADDSASERRILNRFDEVTKDLGQKLEILLYEGVAAEDESYRENIAQLDNVLAAAMQAMGLLYRFDEQGEMKVGHPDLDFASAYKALYSLRDSGSDKSAALADLVQAHRNILARSSQPDHDAFVELNLEKRIGVRLVDPTLIKAEGDRTEQVKKLLTSAKTMQDVNTALIDVLPDFADFQATEGLAKYRDYLARYPQRAGRVELLAQASERQAVLAADKGDDLDMRAYRHEANALWSVLADRPWAGKLERATAAAGLERTIAVEAINEEPDNPLDLAVDLEEWQAFELRLGLQKKINEDLRSQGLVNLIPNDDDDPVVEVLDGDIDVPVKVTQEKRRGFVEDDPELNSVRPDSPIESPSADVNWRSFLNACNWLDTNATAGKQPMVASQTVQDREASICKKLFEGHARKWSTLSYTVGAWTKLPDIEVDTKQTEQIYQIGELIALQFLRKDKASRGSEIFQKYLGAAVAKAQTQQKSAPTQLSAGDLALLEVNVWYERSEPNPKPRDTPNINLLNVSILY